MGTIYGAATILRRWVTAYRAPVPVVGGVTLGGRKTPLALALASSGRPARISSPATMAAARRTFAIDPSRHGAKDVDDEPLLSRNQGTDVIARPLAKAPRRRWAIIPTMASESLPQGSGLSGDRWRAGSAGRVFPAGPLREPFATALRRAQAVVPIGEDRAGIASLIAGRCPILPARLVAADPAAVAGRPVYAFAGIGRPEKFFASLEGAGAVIAGRRSFPDHHSFSESEIAEVLAAAAALNATPITTAKDRLRLPAVRDRVKVFEVILAFDDPAALDAVLEPSLRGDPRSARNTPGPGPR